MGTTIRVKDDTADDLHGLKRRGESYVDVVSRLLDTHRSTNKQQEKENASA